MKRLTIVIAAAGLAACSRQEQGSVGEPDIAGNAVAGVAFTYAYTLELPARRIAGLQEEHARACETLGSERCRITGLRYNVDRNGGVSAGLSVKLAAPVARAFGRQGVEIAERAGATLTGADIGGTEMAVEARARERVAATGEGDSARIGRELARTDLTGEERAELRRRQAAFVEQARAAAGAAGAARDSIATTPLSFSYQTGRGVGVMNQLRDAGDTLAWSIGFTLTAVLWLLTVLGPPLLLAALFYLLWRRWGRRLWRRVAGDGEAA